MDMDEREEYVSESPGERRMSQIKCKAGGKGEEGDRRGERGVRDKSGKQGGKKGVGVGEAGGGREGKQGVVGNGKRDESEEGGQGGLGEGDGSCDEE